jgi:hypothetical protein
MSSAELGLDVIRITEAVDRSLSAGGVPVPVEAISPTVSVEFENAVDGS